ncbi:MAG: hypothetical protein WA885_15210 [Phormidesmis sp.]
MSDILTLEDAERSVVNWVLRQRRSTLAQISQQLQKSPIELCPMLDRLVADGFLSKSAETGRYQISVRTKPQRSGSEHLWDALSD